MFYVMTCILMFSSGVLVGAEALHWATKRDMYAKYGIPRSSTQQLHTPSTQTWPTIYDPYTTKDNS